MALYDKPVRLLFHEMVEKMGIEKGQILTKNEAVEWFGRNCPKVKKGAIAAHLIRLSTNAQSRLHYSAKPRDDDQVREMTRANLVGRHVSGKRA